MKAPLPTVEGIGPSCLRLPDGPWKNILEFLEERFPDVTSETWVSRMSKREVVDENGVPLNANKSLSDRGLYFLLSRGGRRTAGSF